MCASVCALGFFFYLYILSGSNEFLLVFLFVSVCFFDFYFAQPVCLDHPGASCDILCMFACF